LKSNGDALKGLKLSNAGGGKDALQEIFRHAKEEKLHIIRGRTIVAGI